jgi:tripartite-type tricarboxylate transporter receptor subunit TctC
MPADVVSRLNAACNEILAQPEIRKKMEELAITVTPATPAVFTAFVKQQVGQLGPAVKAAGVRL